MLSKDSPKTGVSIMPTVYKRVYISTNVLVDKENQTCCAADWPTGAICPYLEVEAGSLDLVCTLELPKRMLSTRLGDIAKRDGEEKPLRSSVCKRGEDVAANIE